MSKSYPVNIANKYMENTANHPVDRMHCVVRARDHRIKSIEQTHFHLPNCIILFLVFSPRAALNAAILRGRCCRVPTPPPTQRMKVNTSKL
jgi:hypothetical protein